MTVHCPRCGSEFICSNCEYPLRKVNVTTTADVMNAAIRPGSSELREYLEALRRRTPYIVKFPIGPRGGAIIDFGDLISLECFVPYEEEETGELLPFVPMPLTGDIVHDLSRSDRTLCERGECSCDRPVGWRLTKPIIRAFFGVGEAFINEHAGELPGRLPGWRFSVDTVTFMRDCYFNQEFSFPTREASRKARRERHARRWHRRPPRPRTRPRRDGGSRRK